MPVSAELRTSLPPSIDPTAVRAAVRAPGSPGSLGGETWLLDLDGGLAALSRSSIFDALEPLVLAAIAEPVELHASNELEVHRASGESFIIRPSLVEIDAVRALLAGVDGLAQPGDPQPKLEPAPFDARALEDRGVTPPPRAEPVTLTDLDVIDPRREAELAVALADRGYRRCVLVARQIAAQSSPRERDEWNDFTAIVALLGASQPAAAYLWTRGVRRVPAVIRPTWSEVLATELERADEPLLTWAVLAGTGAGEGQVDDAAVAKRAALEAQLELDGPSLEREVAQRARRFLFNSAKAGDRLAQRGLAYALMQLDELDDALMWIRRSIAAERFDFDARMLETRILGSIAVETQDDAELIAALRTAADEFHDRPEPLIDLADHLEFDDPFAAIDCLRRALEREFDEFVLLDLVELFESCGRYSDVMREVEAVLADPDAITVAEVEDKLRAKLASARTRFGLREPSTLATQDRAIADPRGRSRSRVVLLLILFAAFMGLLALV